LYGELRFHALQSTGELGKFGHGHTPLKLPPVAPVPEGI
jgi:hypothetical protein